MYVTAVIMATELAVAVPAAPVLPAPPATTHDAVVAENWATATPVMPEKAIIRRAIKATFQEEKELADAKSKAAAIPRRYFASSQPDQDQYQKFEETFADAKVPGCFKADGLKRQSTFIFKGLLALPFIAVAAVRGKCN